MPLASKAVPRMHPATGMMTLVNRSCARHTHTRSVSRAARNTFHSIHARHRSFDATKTKTHHAALLEVHEPLLALEKLRASSSHTAVRSSVRAHDARFARHIVHARVFPRRPPAIPPDTRRARTDPTLSFHARPPRAHRARILARARSVARSTPTTIDRLPRTFCASTILSLMVDDGRDERFNAVVARSRRGQNLLTPRRGQNLELQIVIQQCSLDDARSSSERVVDRERPRDVRPPPSDVRSIVRSTSPLASSLSRRLARVERRQQHSQISMAHAAFLHACEQYQHRLHLEHFTLTRFPRTPHRLHFLCAR